MLQKRGGRTYLSPMIFPMIPRHGSWQVADQRTQQRRKGTHYVSTCLCALALYMIYVKPVLPHGWGGITAIYHCVFIHSAFELGGYGGKVTIYLRNDKRKKKKNKRMVIIALKEAAQTTIMIFFLRICFEIVKYR